MSLDRLDLMLIDELKDNARQPVRALARKLGVNRETVRYRLNRLTAEGILTIACAANLELLGYQFLVVMGINVSPGKADAAGSRLGALPAIKMISLAAGRYNIAAWALFRDRLALAHFVSEELPAIPDVESIELMHSIKWLKDPWRYFQHQTGTSRTYQRDDFSDLDLSVIKAMQLDPRQPIAKLARTVGCSKLVAKASLQKLVDEGSIRFVTVVNPSTLRYDIGSMILVKCKPDKVNDIAHELSALDTTMHVSLVAGQWQVVVVAYFQDAPHIYNFMSETLTSIPGIIEFEFVPLGRILKYNSSFFGSE